MTAALRPFAFALVMIGAIVTIHMAKTAQQQSPRVFLRGGLIKGEVKQNLRPLTIQTQDHVQLLSQADWDTKSWAIVYLTIDGKPVTLSLEVSDKPAPVLLIPTDP